jgi:hypothetical protein
MSVRNHNLAYRPLRGGIAIVNPANANELGTLGFIGTSNGQDRWIVSAYHVLGRSDGSVFADGEPIYQPFRSAVSAPVALVSRARSDAVTDCAAAEIVNGVGATGEILGIGTVRAPIEPVVGMRVLKSGIETGVTEGVVRQVSGDRIVIAVPAGFPDKYDLSGRGDSGALWISRDAGAPVALHLAGNDTGEEIAFAVRIAKVLGVLGLSAVS